MRTRQRVLDKLMRLLVCNFEYPPLGGGGGVVTAALVRALARRHEVTVLTSRAFDLPPVSFDGRIRVVRVPTLFRKELSVASFASMFTYLASACMRAPGLCRRAGFDAVNTHFVVPTGPVGQWIADCSRIPNVLSLHGGDLYDPSKRLSPHRHRWLRGPVKSMLRRADTVVANSTSTAAHVRNTYGVDRDVNVVPLGIERPPVVAGASRSYFGIPEDVFVAVTIGRLIPRKQTGQLVRAVARSGIANAHLLVIGDGPEAKEIGRIAGELGIAERVKLLGFVSEEDKFRALAVADVFASTSEHEGFGLVFVEALASGLPIVCYDAGGQTDFLASGENGYVIELGDETAFTAALRSLAGSVDQRRAIGVANRCKAKSYFIERCAEQYEAILERAVARRSER